MTAEQQEIIEQLPIEFEKLEDLHSYMKDRWGDRLVEAMARKTRDVWRFGFRARDVLATVPMKERSNEEYVAAMETLAKYLALQKVMFAEDEKHNPGWE